MSDNFRMCPINIRHLSPDDQTKFEEFFTRIIAPALTALDPQKAKFDVMQNYDIGLGKATDVCAITRSTE